LTGDRYSVQADVFSFGVVVWEGLTAQKPFTELTPLQVAQQVKYFFSYLVLCCSYRFLFSYKYLFIYAFLLVLLFSHFLIYFFFISLNKIR
jgi:hypothetical protein